MNAQQFATHRAGLSRDDIRSLCDDCALTMENERNNSEVYVFGPEETNAWAEYSRWLTERELRAAWRKSQRESA